MKFFFCLSLILIFSFIVSGQNLSPEINSKKVFKEQIVESSSGVRASRPKLSLKDAIKVMEKYIKKEKIDTSNYYIWQAKLGQYGSESGSPTVWYFWWLNEKFALGDYIYIVVFMDKKAIRQPSM